MNKLQFYKHYIPALIEALLNENNCELFDVKGPEYYLNVSSNKKKEIDIYLDKVSGQDSFLDEVAYYFDAKSHGFNEIDGINIKDFRKNIENNIIKFKKMYDIK